MVWKGLLGLGIALTMGSAQTAVSDLNLPLSAAGYTPETYSKIVYRALDLTNEARILHGLPPLIWNSSLSQAAAWKAQDMAFTGAVEHLDQFGRRVDARAIQFGYDQFEWLGENLAGGFRDPERVVQAWLKSPKHRDNLLRPEFQEVGIALVHDPHSPHQYYWVQVFGSEDRPSGIIEWTEGYHYANDGELEW